MGSLLLIKDRTEVHKEETNGMYLHEDAAYNYLTVKEASSGYVLQYVHS